jgi:hypothetical protein
MDQCHGIIEVCVLTSLCLVSFSSLSQQEDEGENSSRFDATAVDGHSPLLTVGFVLRERLINRGQYLFLAISSLENNKAPGTLHPIQTTPDMDIEVTSPTKLEWRQKKLKGLSVQPHDFIKNVDLRPFLAILRSAEQLDTWMRCNSENVVKTILQEPSTSDLINIAPPSQPWSEMICMFLIGNFSGKRQKRDLDQTMPICSRFRSTSLFAELIHNHKDPRALTSGTGLGGILFFYLTGQSSLTEKFATSVGFPSSTEEILSTLLSWDENLDGPFENTTLYGTANSLLTFVVGVKTDLSLEVHRHRIISRFNYYFREMLQREWLNLLGTSVNHDITLPFPYKIEFEQMLLFWRRLFIIYGIWGLGSGLLPLQITNTLVEIGLVEHANLNTMSDFVAQSTQLGAARALKDLGFPIERKNASTVALAFIISYQHVKSLLQQSGS